MTLRSKILKGSAALTFGEAAGSGLSLLRNIILARLLTKEDFGVASALLLTVAMLELTSKFAINQIIVQDKSGDRLDFMSAAHFVQFSFAALSFVIMLVLAQSLASVFGLSEQEWAFQLLAFVYLLKGLENLDVRRMVRDFRFVPAVIVELVPQILVTLAVLPLALYLGDYRVIVWLIITRFFITLVLSHLLAERRYRWGFSQEYFGRILEFGWPLLINGFLMFAIYQADRLIVGGFFSMAELAAYAAAAVLAIAPGMLFSKVLGDVTLPLFSRFQDSHEEFSEIYRFVFQFSCAFAILFAVVSILGAEALVVTIFGEKYAGTGTIFAWIASGTAIRIIRTPTVMAALARADTKNPMYANLARVISLPAAMALAMMGQPLWAVAATALFGECFALLAAIWMLSRRERLPFSASIKPVVFVLCGMLVSGFAAWMHVHSWNHVEAFGMALVWGAALAISLVLLFPESRKTLFSLSRCS